MKRIAVQLLITASFLALFCAMNPVKTEASMQSAEADSVEQVDGNGHAASGRSDLITGLGNVLQGAVDDPAVSPDGKTWTNGDIVAAQQFGSHLSIAEWLGPMAPVALSPFFGITCLSAMALFGGDWLSNTNPLLGDHSPLHNSAVFWTFLGLTLLTSLPRLTKVSKPFAQAVDQLEAWSGIVTMILMRVLMSSGDIPAEAEVVQLGILSASADVLMMIAAAVNILVINTVKFFFEMLIWITPVPFLDAAFEFANKSVCALLMAIYAWSPFVATTINLALFLVCALAFGWIYRREVFFRTMLVDAICATLWKQTACSPIVVFPRNAINAIKVRSRCLLTPTDGGWRLVQPRMFRSDLVVEIPRQGAIIRKGLFCNSMTFEVLKADVTFSRRFNDDLMTLADAFCAKVASEEASTSQAEKRTTILRSELS
ncbi:MAG: hypothetical protein KDA91_08250 [Planctomycetaceae bacterium]|nr:hypothetical protein [Planctomycetaceae bacterium]